MLDKTPAADRILIAQLHGEAKHHARWRRLTEAEHAAAVAALRELAGRRADLLAHVVGILEGTSEGELNEPLSRQAAALCRDAGADPEAIPAWVEIGRQRRADARRLPFSGGLRGRRRPDALERRGAPCPALAQLCFRSAGKRSGVGERWPVPCGAHIGVLRGQSTTQAP
jgi:hypothetical protein